MFINRDCSDLLDKIEERNNIAKVLESAETQLILKANKIARKTKEKHEKEKKKATRDGMEAQSTDVDDSVEQNFARGYLVDKYIPKKKRPTYRIPIVSWMPSLPLIGKKVFLMKSPANSGRRHKLGTRGISTDESRDCT